MHLDIGSKAASIFVDQADRHRARRAVPAPSAIRAAPVLEWEQRRFEVHLPFGKDPTGSRAANASCNAANVPTFFFVEPSRPR